MAIGLPKDASGAIVPFDTTMMYRENGNQFHVSDLFFEARPRRWFARSGSECIETNKLYLDSKKRDSWKKLLEDLDSGADADFAFPCAYFDKGGSDCESCIVNMRTDWRTSCDRVAMSEIASRIRKLRGED